MRERLCNTGSERPHTLLIYNGGDSQGMRPSGGRLAVLLALALMLAVPFAAASASAAPGDDTPVEPTEREVTTYGYIANLSDQEENTPLQDVQVTLYDSDKNIVEPSAGTNPVKTDSAALAPTR